MPFSDMSIHGSRPTYRCSECDRQFKTANLGYIHYQEHFAKVYCSSCNVFVHRSEWRRHVQLFHTEAKYECQFCPKSFTSLQALKRHMQGKHLGPWMRCRKCQKTFKSTRGLDRHACVSAKGAAADAIEFHNVLPPPLPDPS